jgi:hypothetical protein
MAKYIRANLELVPEKDITSILKIDAPVMSSKPNEFIEANHLNYYILINCWLRLIEMWSQFGWVSVLNLIRTKGLIEVIRIFSEAADQIVHGVEIESGLVRTLYADVVNRGPIFRVPTDMSRESHRDTMAAILLICRFPKRFSPLKADRLNTIAFDSFRENQIRLYRWQNVPHSTYVLDRVKAAVTSLLDWDKLCDELEGSNLLTFTPGVSFDTDASLVSKLQSIQAEHVECFYQPFGIPCVASKGVAEPEFWGKQGDIEKHLVRLLAVPKNFKTARVIAPENVYRQALARTFFNICDRYLPESVKLHDQTQNQRLALSGSLDGLLATLDLHAASDSVTQTLFYSVFPARFSRIMERILPTHYTDGKREYRLQCVATMGNSMTFWIESVVFLGIAKAATDYVRLFDCGDDLDIVDDRISVYGDDIILPTRAASTCIEWLEELGFVVNTDKSFFSTDHLYRESCGEEYYEGRCVSNAYFPRFPLVGQLGGKLSPRGYRDGFRGTHIDTMTSIIDLQHKLFNLCVPASKLLSEIVRESEPRMTTSAPDRGLSDLWDYLEEGKVIPAPAGKILPQPDGKPKYPMKVQKLVVDGMVRDGHLGPITCHKAIADPSAEEVMLYSLYKYEQFLRFGPRYDDPLSELLGISAPPLTFEEARTRSEIKWVYIK